MMTTKTLRIPTLLSLFIGVLLLQNACKTEPANNAPLIERNDDVKEYFSLLDTLVGEYCSLVENMVEEGQAIEEKEANGEEANIMDGFNLLSGMIGSTVRIVKIAEQIEELEERHPEFEEDLSAADFEEFMDIYLKMMKRFMLMAKKLDESEKAVN